MIDPDLALSDGLAVNHWPQHTLTDRARRREPDTLMRNIFRATMLSIASIVMVLGWVSESYAETDAWNDEPGHVVIDGHSYGPEDGVVTTYEAEILPREVDSGATPMATWGSSYAYSTHPTSFNYVGWARAGGNVYNGQRIVQVCMRYSRGGTYISGWRCSTATSSGTHWNPGLVESLLVRDSLDPDAPVTVFHTSTSRINPAIF